MAQHKQTYILVSPAEAVRPELPASVDMHLSADVRKELEAVLNRGKRFIPADVLNGRLAAALHIPELNASIAFELLSRLSREDSAARTRSVADLGLLHLFLGCSQQC